MKRDNRRACQNIYVSFFDFGGAALSKEGFWLTIATLRGCDLKYVEGGMSQVTKQMLKLMFNIAGYNLRDSGISIQLHGGKKLGYLQSWPVFLVMRVHCTRSGNAKDLVAQNVAWGVCI